MSLWNQIEALRKANADNPNYPKVYWLGEVGKGLFVKVGDFEQSGLSVEEAKQLFGDNELFMMELRYLLESPENEDSKFLGISETHNTEAFEPVSVERMIVEIDDKIDEIINELHLEQSNDMFVQLKNCCLVQKYIVENIEYQGSIMDEKEDMPAENIRIMDLYNAAIRHVGVCTSNSILFQEIIRRLGIRVECVALESSEGGFHMANLVELGGQYYYFDSTLERTIYDDYSQEGMDLILCCAALGAGEYEPFYSPKAVMPDDPLAPVLPIPDNVAPERIPQTIVNEMIKSSGDAKA